MIDCPPNALTCFVHVSETYESQYFRIAICLKSGIPAWFRLVALLISLSRIMDGPEPSVESAHSGSKACPSPFVTSRGPCRTSLICDLVQVYHVARIKNHTTPRLQVQWKLKFRTHDLRESILTGTRGCAPASHTLTRSKFMAWVQGTTAGQSLAKDDLARPCLRALAGSSIK